MSFVLLTHLLLSLLAGKAEPRWMFYQTSSINSNVTIDGNDRYHLKFECTGAGRDISFLQIDGGYAISGTFKYRKKLNVRVKGDTMFVYAKSGKADYEMCQRDLAGYDDCGNKSVFYIHGFKAAVVVWKDDRNECGFVAGFTRKWVRIKGNMGNSRYNGGKKMWNNKWSKEFCQYLLVE